MGNEELQAVLLAVLEAGSSSQPEADGSLSEDAQETMALLLDQVGGGAALSSDVFLAQDVWQPYQGGRGGRGWRNVQTGEVLYQQEKPGEGQQTASQQAARPPAPASQETGKFTTSAEAQAAADRLTKLLERFANARDQALQELQRSFPHGRPTANEAQARGYDDRLRTYEDYKQQAEGVYRQFQEAAAAVGELEEQEETARAVPQDPIAQKRSAFLQNMQALGLDERQMAAAAAQLDEMLALAAQPATPPVRPKREPTPEQPLPEHLRPVLTGLQTLAAAADSKQVAFQFIDDRIAKLLQPISAQETVFLVKGMGIAMRPKSKKDAFELIKGKIAGLKENAERVQAITGKKPRELSPQEQEELLSTPTPQPTPPVPQKTKRQPAPPLSEHVQQAGQAIQSLRGGQWQDAELPPLVTEAIRPLSQEEITALTQRLTGNRRLRFTTPEEAIQTISSFMIDERRRAHESIQV